MDTTYLGCVFQRRIDLDTRSLDRQLRYVDWQTYHCDIKGSLFKFNLNSYELCQDHVIYEVVNFLSILVRDLKIPQKWEKREQNKQSMHISMLFIMHVMIFSHKIFLWSSMVVLQPEEWWKHCWQWCYGTVQWLWNFWRCSTDWSAWAIV